MNTTNTTALDESRDDFSPVTKELLAKRSGYICAYPGCKRMTVAGSDDRKSGLTLIGVAAHITAASKKGPRYDENMSAEERASENNGIWMCQIHGKFIDDNPSRCTVTDLWRWKSQHEAWVFNRVESGNELFNKGTYRLSFKNIGIFSNSFSIGLGRHNILVAKNEAGKTTFCQILAAFSGGYHWNEFQNRFNFTNDIGGNSYIEALNQNNQNKISVRLTSNDKSYRKRAAKSKTGAAHISLNGSPAVDWPRAQFKVLYFDEQLYRAHHSDPKDTFVKALRYLANILNTHEDLIWDSLRDELFVDSVFGNRIRRIGHRKIEIRVPDGRDFYLPHTSLSFTEQQLALLDIALKFLNIIPATENLICIFDTAFFQRFDPKRKADLFKELIKHDSIQMQTLFCLNSSDDAEILKELNSDRWINAEKFRELTLHSFI